MAEVDFDEMVMSDSFQNLADSYGALMTHQQQLADLDGWARNNIEERDGEMEDGNIRFTPFNRMYFRYDDGTETGANLRYWENEDNSLRGVGNRRFTNNLDDHDEQANEMRELMNIVYSHLDELGGMDVLNELDDRADDMYMMMNQGMDGYAFFEPENHRRPTEHPDYNFMMNELFDQGRIDEVEDGGFDINDRNSLRDGEDEEGLIDNIFSADFEDAIFGYNTSPELMTEHLNRGEEIMTDAIQNFRILLRRFNLPEPEGLPEENVAEVNQGEPVDVEENMPTSRTGEEDLIFDPGVEDEEPEGADIINLESGTTQRI